MMRQKLALQVFLLCSCLHIGKSTHVYSHNDEALSAFVDFQRNENGTSIETEVAMGVMREVDTLPVFVDAGVIDPAVTAPPSDNPIAQAGTACPEGSQFVDRCFESLMDTIQQSGALVIPPDPHGAAGMTSVIAVTNTEIEARTKHGDLIFGPILLLEMFGNNVIPEFQPTRVFDPKIVYDVHQDRFVVVVLDRVENESNVVVSSSILVAVSKDGDPTSTSDDDWWFLTILSLINNTRADYPGIAVDEEAIYITNNMFPVAPGMGTNNVLLWIIDKEPFYSGGNADVEVYDYITESGSVDDNRVTHMPAMVRSPQGIAPGVGTYLVAYNGLNEGGDRFIQIIRIDDPLGNPVFTQVLVNVGPIDAFVSFPNAPQPGTSVLIETNDNRALDSVWVNNELWMVTTIRTSTTQTAAYWLKFEANGVNPPSISDQGAINGNDIEPGTSTYFASLDVNSNGVAAFGFAASSALNIFGSAYATIRDDATDEAGTVRSPDVVKAGLAPYNLVLSGTRNRWGDYTGMALDPEEDQCFWAFNEYAGNTNVTNEDGQFGNWKTAWARLCYPAISSSPSEAPSSRPSLMPSASPSQSPSSSPSSVPSVLPSQSPSRQPSTMPSTLPSQSPSSKPSIMPSTLPSQSPSRWPSRTPSTLPSQAPSIRPSIMPSAVPSQAPSSKASSMPFVVPSAIPSVSPSAERPRPSGEPTKEPSSKKLGDDDTKRKKTKGKKEKGKRRKGKSSKSSTSTSSEDEETKYNKRSKGAPFRKKLLHVNALTELSTKQPPT